MKVAKLTENGISRMIDGAAGMTFVVDSFSDTTGGKNAHVRDYRRPTAYKSYQIWTLSPDQYELVE